MEGSRLGIGSCVVSGIFAWLISADNQIDVTVITPSFHAVSVFEELSKLQNASNLRKLAVCMKTVDNSFVLFFNDFSSTCPIILGRRHHLGASFFLKNRILSINAHKLTV